MTNKEAVELLKPLFDQCKGTDSCMGYIEHYFTKAEEKSLDLAINALGERPKGEWIMQRHDLDGCFYTCSNCGRMIRVPLFIDDPEDNETLADYPFCHCGADMRGSADNDSCETCMYQKQPDYCEPKNKKLYGFCGNFTRLDNADLLPRIYKCPKCLYLFNGRYDPDKCPKCGATVKKGGKE